MAYSESLFLFLLILAMYGLAARWRIWIIALIVGIATGTRPVGVALLLPFAYCIWRRSVDFKTFIKSLVPMTPLACWGLLAYMVFLQGQFGDAVAFASNQSRWSIRRPESTRELVMALATLEPIWGAYSPSNFAFWKIHDMPGNATFSLRFADPLFFTTTMILVIVGAWKRWLTREEVLLAAGLLLIPYLTKSYSAVMQSQGRYSSVVFPVYIVMGQLISRLPQAVSCALYALGTFFLSTYAALFAAWYKIV